MTMTTISPESNPIGLDGMDFIEFTAPKVELLTELFDKWGFTKVAQHQKKNISLFKQGDVNFLLNRETSGYEVQFAKLHGPSICATGFRVRDAEAALREVLKRGAKEVPASENSFGFPAIYGIGDSHVYLVDRYSTNESWLKRDFDGDEALGAKAPHGYGLEVIDHLTNNVPRGEMDRWCDFYTRIFNFRETRYFDIRGKATGLVSKVMRSPCGKFSIPINEPTDTKSQIQEYLDEYKGSGIQHVALLTQNIVPTMKKLRERGNAFLEVPNTYYEMIPGRVPNVTEDLKVLSEQQILVDGDQEGYLLQIFSKNLCGPIFFEVIQRKNHFGFGEGNFQALFDAIERDQKQRGYL